MSSVVARLALAGWLGACATPQAGVPREEGSTALALVQRVDHVDVLAREPMIAEHPSGALFVTGYGPARPVLWTSGDGGATWARVDVGTEAQGAVGNSDVDLAVAPDGTLYFAAMLYDRQKFEGVQIAVGTSRDAGATWRWSLISRARYDDRPWVDVAPDGTAHVIWNDGKGVHHAVSRDRGATWTRMGQVHDRGGSSHLAVGPGGEVAVRISPRSASGRTLEPDVDYIAVSTDRGATWRKTRAPGTRVWREQVFDRWVEPLAWDARGRLYSFWADGRDLWLARSADRGASWSSWKVSQERDSAFFPYLAARGGGELAATWFTGGDSLYFHVAALRAGGGDAPPRMVRAGPFAPEAWERPHMQPNAPVRRTAAGEYLPVALLRDGRIAVASPIQSPGRNGFTWWAFAPRAAAGDARGAFGAASGVTAAEGAANPRAFRVVPLRTPSGDAEIVAGHPDSAGPFVMRIRELAGTVIPPHSHPVDENLTVLSGHLYFGTGERFDSAATRRLDAGAYAFIPAGTTMFGYVPEEMIVQVHGHGPFHIHWKDSVRVLDEPGGAAYFRYRRGDAVDTPRGPGRIRQGYRSGAVIQYEIDGAGGARFMAHEGAVRRR